jgi:glycosyltransferase involved in cell wall biosynthesis
VRILFVHEVNYRRKVVYEIHDFPELMAKRGHDVTFVDFPEGEPRRGLRRFLDLRTEVSHACRAHEGGEIEVVTPGRVLPPPADRLAATLTHVPVLRRLLASGDFDVMVLYGAPTNGWQAMMLAHHYRVPVVFRAIDISHALRKTIFKPLIKAAERYIYGRADAISTHNVALRDYIVGAGGDPAKITIDYPGIDLERFDPAPRDPKLQARYGLSPDTRVILFMGTLYRFAGLGWFLDGIAPFLRDTPDVTVLLVGGGEQEAALREQVDQLGLGEQVRFTGFIDYDELAAHLRLADVAINPFDEQLVTRCALPGKVLQSAAVGVPTVCTRLDGMAGLIPEGEGILYRAPGKEFLAAVEELLDDRDRAAELGRSARTTMELTCRWDHAAAGFEKVLADRCRVEVGR